MDYHYLQATGALNEAPTAPGPRAASPPPMPSRRPNKVGKARRQGRDISPKIVALVPESFARQHMVFPVALEGELLTVLAVDPDDIALADQIAFLSARKVRLVRAGSDEITGLIHRHHGEVQADEDSVDSWMQEFDADDTIGHPPAPASPLPGVQPAGRGGLGRARPISLRMESSLPPAAERRIGAMAPIPSGQDPTKPVGDPGVFTYVVEEGQRVLLRRPDGTMDVIVGPKRVWRGSNVFRPMTHFVAHPGDYLIVRHRDGRQEHLAGPSEVWLDPRVHQEITREEALQVAAKEAVVVYSQKEGTSHVQRRIEFGPTLFIPRPGEWLHTFAWHSSEGGSQGARKVPRGLVFQKLWMLPDQMYHDVPDVRTADDAVLTIRLMLFFELLDISTMLETTHDPIGDFVNAATSDVVDFTGRHDFESFKRNTDKLNELETYRQLSGRASQCGYRINKVVYRGYGAPDRLQQMHDQAIEARTRLQLDRATEQQAQDLENFRLDSQMLRAGKRRGEQANEVDHDLALATRKQEADLCDRESRLAFQRQQGQLAAELRQRLQSQADSQRREHLSALLGLGVDLTAYLTQGRADRVIELRGAHESTHVHLEATRGADTAGPTDNGVSLG